MFEENLKFIRIFVFELQQKNKIQFVTALIFPFPRYSKKKLLHIHHRILQVIIFETYNYSTEL